MIKDLSIIIPYRFYDTRRNHIFEWILERYRLVYPEATVVVADSDEDKRFSRSQSRNHGVDMANTKYILIADADTMSFRPFIEEGLRMMAEGEANWVIPYGQKGYYNLRHPYSDYVLSCKPNVFITPDKFEWQHQLLSWAGQLLMSTDSFYKVNGYDERFQGWGYEDNAFQHAMDTIVGGHSRVEAGWTAHIWHPEPRSERWDHPDFLKNKLHMHNYVSAVGDVEEMTKVVQGNRK